MKNIISIARNAVLFLTLAITCMALKCKREPEIDPIVASDPSVVIYPDSLAGELNLQFMHSVDNQPLVFETQQYTNPAGDSFKVVDLRYYISNLKLKNTNKGNLFSFPNSYYLLAPKENKINLSLKGIPVKDFDQVEFSIGVDSTANATNLHKGDLDPAIADVMLWPWNTGYKFLFFGGKRISQKPDLNNNGLSFHIGENKNYKTITFPLSQILSFQKGKPYTISVGVNLNELFRNPNLIDFDTVNNVADNNPNADRMANNYANGMFSIKSISR